MIVLDADVLIAHLNADDVHHARATELLLQLRSDSFAASTLTLAEVLVGPARAGRLARQEARLAQLEITSVPLESEASAPLATIRAETGLKLPDCCVLHAAEASGGELATFDARLAKAARQRGVEVHP